MKKTRSVTFLVLLIVLVLFILNFQSINDYLESSQGDFPVTVTIDCRTVLSNTDKLDENLKNSKYIPKNGIILPKTKVYINEDDSVLDALKKIAKEHNLQLEYTQSPKDSYVEGINYLYEFSCGELSGWMYAVNGNFANKGADSYKLTEGDDVCWIYTCDLGKDIGEEYK